MQALRSLLTRMFAYVGIRGKYGDMLKWKEFIPLSGLRGRRVGRAYTSSHWQHQPTKHYISKVSAVSSDSVQVQHGSHAGPSQ